MSRNSAEVRLCVFFMTEKPTIIQSPEPLLLRNVSDSVTLTCVATGCPDPEVKWKNVSSNTILHVGNSYHIPKVSRVHDGSYACMATTGGVAVTETTDIKIQCKYLSSFSFSCYSTGTRSTES